MRAPPCDRAVAARPPSAASAPAAPGAAAATLAELRPELDLLPLPGAGATLDRFGALAALGRRDLSVARLAEGHADARAILHEIAGTGSVRPVDGLTLGVWAADPHLLRAEPVGAGWRLTGSKGWCSGSLALDAALLTATAPDGPRLFLVPLAGAPIAARPGSWEPLGMAATRSETLDLDGVLLDGGAAVGGPGAYVGRPGFGHGGTGVAACWWGGAVSVLDGVSARATAVAGQDGAGDALCGVLGAAHADLDAAWCCLADAAARIDARPDDTALAHELAARTRLVVAAAARRTLAAVVDVLGAGGLCHDAAHARRVADLTVYLGQLRRGPAEVEHGRRVLAAGAIWADLPWSSSWS